MLCIDRYKTSIYLAAEERREWAAWVRSAVELVLGKRTVVKDVHHHMHTHLKKIRKKKKKKRKKKRKKKQKKCVGKQNVLEVR